MSTAAQLREGSDALAGGELHVHHERRRFFSRVVAVGLALLVTFGVLLAVAGPEPAAEAADGPVMLALAGPPEFEIAGAWVSPPAAIGSGDVVVAQWHLNVNDSADPPGSDPVDDVTATFTLANGTFDGIPDVCLTAGVAPVSSISADGMTLTCNLGTVNAGTAVSLQTPVLADGATGDDLTLSGEIGGSTFPLPEIPIENEFGMDIRWGAPSSFQDVGSGFRDMDFEWTLSHDTGSEPGPTTVVYDLTIASAQASSIAVGPQECTPFDGAFPADGHPWSGGTHPPEQTANFVTSCTLVQIDPTTFRLTIDGIDYAPTDPPTEDSTGARLPTGEVAVASGSIWVRIFTTTAGSVSLTSDAPLYTSPAGPTATDDASNNTSSKTWVLPGVYSSGLGRSHTGNGGTTWDGTYHVAPGTTIRQYMDTGLNLQPALDDSWTVGMCSALDTRYVTFEGVQQIPNRPPGTVDAFVQYYTGSHPTLDPASLSYNPNDTTVCATDDGSWSSTPPADLSTVRAVRIVFSQAEAEEHSGSPGVAWWIDQRIRDDAPAGTDVWSFFVGHYQPVGWFNATPCITSTPGLRYPCTTGFRDLVRIITATPAVEKDATDASITPGVPAEFTLTYSANGAGTIPATIDDFTMVDTLPDGMTYVAGSATPEPAITTDGSGQQVLTWTLDGVPTNTENALTYEAVADASVEAGASLTNSVIASFEGSETAPVTEDVVASSNGSTSLVKAAGDADLSDGTGSWTVTLQSSDPLPQAYTDTIDILPYDGDGQGTSFSGTLALDSVTAPAGATVYYTDADPATLSDDPADSSNGAVGDPTGNTAGWTTTEPATVTAIRVIGGQLDPGATFEFEVLITTAGGAPGDAYVNRAQSRAEHTMLVMRTSALLQAPVIDFGDAPDTYGTTISANGPSHDVADYDAGANAAPLMLGSSVDVEPDGLPSAGADGDDLDDAADEDGVADPIVVFFGQTTTVSVAVTNDTGESATLAGWIDLDLNGTFDASERVTVTVPPGTASYDLEFPEATVYGEGTYARFRLFPGEVADPQPLGAAAAGEVEDHPVEGPVQEPFECGAEGFLFQGESAVSPTDVFRVDLATGVTSPLASGVTPLNTNAVGYNPLDDYLYGFSDNEVVRIGADFSAVFLGAPAGLGSHFSGSPFIGEVTPDGLLWVASSGSGTVTWAAIDLAPSSPTYMEAVELGSTVMPANAGQIADWAYNPVDGFLYTVSQHNASGTRLLLRFDPVTGAITQAADLTSSGMPATDLFGAIYSDPDGFLYASHNGTGEIWRVDLASGDAVLFADGPSSAQNDGARCYDAPLPIDFGDAPASYGTLLEDDGPRHAVPDYDAGTDTAPLMLGSSIDIESDGVPSADADGDDLDDAADEDGVADPIVVFFGQTTTVSVAVTNDTGEPATLAGWIDLDLNGTFDPSERVVVTVPPGAGSYDLEFPVPSVYGDGTYARFRLFPGEVADPSPLGAAAAGEVEDHPVEGPVQEPFECGAEGFLFQSIPTDVFSVDLASGETSEVASDITTLNTNGVGYNPLDDYVYGFTNNEVVRIGSDFSVVSLGVPTGLGAHFPGSPFIGEVTPDGSFWVAYYDAGNVLWAAIDLETSSPTYMQATSIGSTPSPANVTGIFDWSYNPVDGQLYTVSTGPSGARLLLRFNPATGALTQAANLASSGIPPTGAFGATYTDPDGFLYASHNTTGEIWRVDMASGDAVLFAQGPLSGANDGARCYDAPLPIDFGDAPDSYGTLLADDGPRHAVPGYVTGTNTAPLALGSSIDIESDGVPSAGADGDDLADAADEDVVSGPFGIDVNQATFELEVPFTNETGDLATIAAWIDFDGNGTFDPDERATAEVGATGTVTLVWTIPGDAVEGDSYARFRVFPGEVADPSPLGSASAGEVEDHRVVLQALAIDKVTVGELVANGDGTYTATYDITVTNDGVAATTYDLDDELQYGAGISVVSAGVLDLDPGTIVTNGSWDGDGDTSIVAGEAIAGETSHTYRVTVVVTVADGIDPSATDCVEGTPGEGSGLLNGATLTTGGEQLEDEACVEVPDVGIDKEIVGTPTPNGDGTYTLVYELTVTNGGAGDGVYDLDDELALGDGITVVGDPTVTNPVPGGIVTNPAWDGDTDTGIVTAEPIAGSTAHVYEVTVIVDVPAGLTGDAADCELDGGETGTGLSNSASITTNGEVREDEDCVPVGSVTIGKDLVVGPTPNGDGTYSLEYDITVTNIGGASTTYDLDDELLYGDGITVDSASVSNTAPGTITTNGAWDGEGTTDVVAGETIAADDTHTYRVVVVASVSSGLTTESGDCELGDGEAGTGFLNSATLTSNGQDQDAEDCAEVGLVEIDKTHVGDPVANGDGTYTIEYDLTVTNVGAGSTTYDLADELQYGDGITVDSATVSNTAPSGIVTNPLWDGDTDTSIVTGEAIAGAATHVYRVTVVAAVPTDLPGEAADCELGDGEDGTGFLNSATLTENGIDTDAEDCAELAAIDIDKTHVGDPTPNGDGTYTIEYDLTVTNTGGADGPYDLSDELQYGDGITVDSATAGNTAPGTITTNGAWDGDTDTSIVAGQTIGQGQTHVYRVTVVAEVPAGITTEAADCELGDGEDGTGFLNSATLTVNGVDDGAEDCSEVAVIGIEKEHVGEPTANGDGTYTIEYDLTVTNSGGADGTYDLDDELLYGDGITVDSATVGNTAPGTITTNGAWDGDTDTSIVAGQTIGQGQTHVYRVTVVAEVPAGITTEAADCELGDGEDGTGFLNSATLSVNGLEADAEDCSEAAVIGIEKEHVGEPTANGDGTYTIEYDLTVTNLSAGAEGVYDLDDELLYGDGITVVGTPTVSNTAPGGIVTNPAWDGQGTTSIVSGEPIGASATHVYRVAVVAELGASTTPEAADCELADGEDGTGFLNSATLTVNGVESDAEDCSEVAVVEIDKTHVGEPVANGDGTYTIEYDLTVTNAGGADGAYDLDDELLYGAGITVDSASVSNTAPGTITTNGAWDGDADTSVVAGQSIGAGQTHVYRVIVVATVPAGITSESADCELADGEDGTGFLNSATLTENGVASEDEDCAELAAIDIDKTHVGEPTANGDGTYTIEYDLTVTNSGGADGTYDLDDELLYGDGITVVGTPTVSNTAPGTITTNGAWDGDADTSVVAGQTIGQGQTHVYRVTVVAELGAGTTPEASDCELGDGEDGTGFLNSATLEVNGVDTDAEDCSEVAVIAIEKEHVGEPTANGDGTYTIEYDLTVTNLSAGADGTYDLDDELLYGDGITVVGTPTVSNTAPGTITTNGAWDGDSDTSVVAGQTIGQGQTHVYRVTVVAELGAGTTPEASDCELGDGEDGTGFLNSATLEVNGVDTDAEDCSEVAVIAIEKEHVGEPTANGDGTYTIEYDLTVTNLSAGAAGVYDLDDELQYGDGITVVGTPTVSNTAPGGITTNGAWDGDADTGIVAGQAIGGGATHVYRVAVVAELGAGTTPEASDCELGDGEDGTGFLNSATLTVNGVESEDEDCAEVAVIAIEKEHVGEPVANGDGTYTIEYDLTVTNSGGTDGTYDLDDELLYGDGITVESTTVSNTAPGGITTNGAWDGDADTSVVAGQSVGAGQSHVYRVTVVAAVPAGTTSEAADCELGDGEDGTGFLNSATLTENGVASEDEDCSEVAVVELDKTMVGEPVANGDGTFTATYEITVTNASAAADGVYDLSDELAYGAGISVVSAGVANTAPGTITTNGAWDGDSDTSIVSDQTIGAGQVHVYLLTVVVTLPVDLATEASDCELEAGEDGTGLLNGATLDVNGVETEDEACGEVPVLSIDKTSTGSPVPNGDGTYTIEYDLTVTNSGGGAGSYDLDDELQYGAGVTVDSAGVTNTAPGTITTNGAWDGTGDTSVVSGQAIGAGQTHVYRVTVVAAASSLGATSEADCELTDGEAGTGFLNSATLISNGVESEDEACEPTPRVSFDKAMVDAPVGNGDGSYTITYDITVSNDGDADTSYDLSDELRYGAGVTVDSAAVSNTAPGGITTNPAWDGDTDTQIVAGEPLAGGAVHVYRVIVVASVPEQLAPGAGDCELGQGEAGTGFLNESSLAINGEVTRDEDCAELPSLSIDKTVDGEPVANGDGTFTQTYDITVSNTGAAAGVYDLADELTYGDSIAVDSATVSNTTPGGITTNGGWNGTSDTSIVDGESIAGGDTHVYRVVVVVAVEAGGLGGPASDCVLGDGEDGTGLRNEATISSNGIDQGDEACSTLPNITIDKAHVGSPTPEGDGSFTITYDITVANDGAGAGVYDLVDELTYGAGITVDSASVSNTTPGGITTNGAWDGTSDTGIVAGEAIAAGTSHVYRVVVRATPPADLADDPAAGDCTLGGGEDGTGFLNTATVTSNGQDQDAEDCAPVPALSITKDVAEGPTANGDGTTTLTYAITVANPTEAPTVYDLDDTLRFGTGVTVESASVSNTTPGDITTNGAWNGVGDPSIVSGEAIGPMTSHVYLVTVTVSLDDETLTAASGDCTLEGGEDGTGLRNDASVSWNGVTAEDDECVPVGIVGMTKAHTGTVENGDGTVTSTYELVVTNVGGAPGTYDLADQLAYGPGITIESATVSNTTPGGIATNGAWNGQGQTSIVSGQAIDADTTHVFTVTVVARPAVDIDPAATDCEPGGGPGGSGLFNGATLTSDGVTTEAEACDELPALTVDKTHVGAPVPNGDGTWTLAYDLTVANDGAAPGTYDLADELQLGAGISVSSASVINTAPGGIATNAGYDGTTSTGIVAGQAIGAGATHVYRVTVVAAVPAGIDPAVTDCEPGGGTGGSGFANTAELEANGVVQDDEDCAPVPAISIEKSMLGEPVVQEDGSHVVTYRIVVTNGGAGNGTYHLDDELRYGDGVGIASVAVENLDPGTIATSSSWDGVGDIRIASDVDLAAGVAHTYEVVVTTDPALSVGGEAGDCELGSAEDGTGFLNTSTVTTNGIGIDDDACAEVTISPVDITKTMLGEPVADGAGGHTITYEIQVTNPGEITTVYDLDDRLRYGAGITVTGATVANVDPGSVTTEDDWDGLTATRVATAATIGAGATHTYQATITAQVPDGITDDQMDCELDDGEEGSGFLNEATATQGSTAHHDDACVSVLTVQPIDPGDPGDPSDPGSPQSGGGFERLAYTGAALTTLVLLGLGLIAGGTYLSRRGRRRTSALDTDTDAGADAERVGR